jgi:hypothetical protein
MKSRAALTLKESVMTVTLKPKSDSEVLFFVGPQVS